MEERDSLTSSVIGAAIEVHKLLGWVVGCF